MDAESRQAVIDQEHLRLLSIGYIIEGVMSGIFSLLGIFYAGMGVLMSNFAGTSATSATHPPSAPPPEIGWFFGIFGAVFFLVFASMATAKFFAASCIKQRKGRVFCMIVGGIACLGVPYGTCLGVCTFLVLARPSVASLFRSANSR